MNRLIKKRQRLDSVEAYACMCLYASCTCSCGTCYCGCQSGNRTATDRIDALNTVSHNMGTSNLYNTNPAEAIAV